LLTFFLIGCLLQEDKDGEGGSVGSQESVFEDEVAEVLLHRTPTTRGRHGSARTPRLPRTPAEAFMIHSARAQEKQANAQEKDAEARQKDAEVRQKDAEARQKDAEARQMDAEARLEQQRLMDDQHDEMKELRAYRAKKEEEESVKYKQRIAQLEAEVKKLRRRHDDADSFDEPPDDLNDDDDSQPDQRKQSVAQSKSGRRSIDRRAHKQSEDDRRKKHQRRRIDEEFDYETETYMDDSRNSEHPDDVSEEIELGGEVAKAKKTHKDSRRQSKDPPSGSDDDSVEELVDNDEWSDSREQSSHKQQCAKDSNRPSNKKGSSDDIKSKSVASSRKQQQQQQQQSGASSRKHQPQVHRGKAMAPTAADKAKGKAWAAKTYGLGGTCLLKTIEVEQHLRHITFLSNIVPSSLSKHSLRWRVQCAQAVPCPRSEVLQAWRHHPVNSWNPPASKGKCHRIPRR